MYIKVVLQGTESTIRVLFPQPGQELAKLLSIHTLLEGHVEINSLTGRYCKDHGDGFHLVHPIVNLKGLILQHPGSVLIGLGSNDELVKIHHLVALLDHKIIR